MTQERIKQFDHPNMAGGDFVCRFCRTQTDAPVVLVGGPGTKDGNNMDAEEMHSECYVLAMKMRGVEVIIENK